MQVGISQPSSFSMRVSSKAHYGLRMMTEFAKADGRGPLSLAEVARTEHLPLPYIEHLAAQLRRAGLIDSRRGVHGGYVLTRSPRHISVLDIVRTVDGEVAPVECVAHDYTAGTCVREDDCASRPLWMRLKHSIESVLGETSLADLVQQPQLVDELASIPSPKEAAHA
jgi:Rrf2 family cysteine metabolism transcriptional repressor